MIELTALKGNSPIGCMAAYGVLRILYLSRIDAVLCFNPETSQATIGEVDDKSILLDALKHYIESNDCAPGFDVPKTGVDILDSNFGPALYVEDSEGIKKTVFNRVAGSSDVIKLARKARLEILKNTRNGKSTEDNFTEALYGPWYQNDSVSTFGWNPADKKEAASLAGSKIPKELKHRTVVAANWLAFEGLPLLAPIALISGKNEWYYPLPSRVTYQEASALMYGFSNLKERDLKAMQAAVN
jgi:hypothetical protein